MGSDLRLGEPSAHEVRPGYIVELRLDRHLVLFVGGGSVAQGKLADLFSCGAQVKIVDPDFCLKLPRHPQLTRIVRAYQSEDLDGAQLVFAATGDPSLNAQVVDDCARRGILCSRIDAGLRAAFTSPARFYRVPLQISVSTSGQCPAIAALLRDQLATQLSPAWQILAQLAAVIRQKVLTEKLDISYNRQVFLRMLHAQVLRYIEQADIAALNHLLLQNFGPGFSLGELNFSLPEGSS